MNKVPKILRKSIAFVNYTGGANAYPILLVDDDITFRPQETYYILKVQMTAHCIIGTSGVVQGGALMITNQDVVTMDFDDNVIFSRWCRSTNPPEAFTLWGVTDFRPPFLPRLNPGDRLAAFVTINGVAVAGDATRGNFYVDMIPASEFEKML